MYYSNNKSYTHLALPRIAPFREHTTLLMLSQPYKLIETISKSKTKHTSCGQDLRDHTFKCLLSLFTHNISPEGLLIPCYFHLCSCNPTNFAYKTYIPKACPKQSRAETTRYNIESTAFNLLIIYLLFII